MMNGTVGIKRKWNKFLNWLIPSRRKRLLSEMMRNDQELGLYDLSREDIEKIIKTCQDSPEPNVALRQAAKRYMSKDNLHCHYSDLPSPMSYIKPEKIKNMTKQEAQTELIEVLENQVMQLSVMSKIELGDDVIEEINRLKEIIKKKI